MNNHDETPAIGHTLGHNRRTAEARRLAAAGVSAPTIAALMADWTPPPPPTAAARETHLEHVADCALAMARTVRANPARVWNVLCAMDPQTLRETAMVALLGIPAHQPKPVVWQGIA